MNEYETKTLIITCLGPIHIGCGGEGKLNKTQYVFDREQLKLYFIKEPAWVAFLQQKRLLKLFEQYVSVQAMRPSLGIFDWLRQQGVGREVFDHFSYAVASVPASGRSMLNDVAPFLRDGCNQAYVPGSSIKGVFRTAILARLLKKRGGNWWPRVKEVLTEQNKSYRDRRARDLVNEMENAAFHLLQLNHKNRPIDKRNAVCSAMKGLLVGDAYPIGGQLETVIIRKTDWTTQQNRMGDNEKELPLYRECLRPGTKLAVQVTIDKSLMNLLNISGIEALLQDVRQHTADVDALLRPVFSKMVSDVYRETPEVDLYLGGGAGFLMKSLAYQLAPDQDVAREAVAVYLDNAFAGWNQRERRIEAKHHHVALDKLLSPRTLKVGKIDGRRYFIGACRISEDKDDSHFGV